MVIYNNELKQTSINFLELSEKNNYKALHSYLLTNIKHDKKYAYLIFKEIDYNEHCGGKELSSYQGYEQVITSGFELIYIYNDYTYNSCYVGIFHETQNNCFINGGFTASAAKETESETNEILKSIKLLKKQKKIINF
jgi:hypothetical protein